MGNPDLGRIGKTYLVDAGGEKSNIDVMRAILECMGQPKDVFDWVRDHPSYDWRYANDSSKLRTDSG